MSLSTMPGARPVRDQASDLAEEAATGELDDANACSDHEEDNWGLSSSSGEKDDDSEDSDYEASRQVRKQEGVRQKNRQAAHQPPVKKQLPRVQYCTVSMAELYQWHLEGTLRLDASYQRDVVWDVDTRRTFIDSLQTNHYAPALLINERQGREEAKGAEARPLRWVIDGKQRCTSIIAFMEGRLAIDGGWVARLDPAKNPRRSRCWPQALLDAFSQTSIQLAKYVELSDADEREVFQRVQLSERLTDGELLAARAGPIADWVKATIASYWHGAPLLNGRSTSLQRIIKTTRSKHVTHFAYILMALERNFRDDGYTLDSLDAVTEWFQKAAAPSIDVDVYCRTILDRFLRITVDMAGIADDDDSLTASNPVFVTLLENGKVKARKLSPVEFRFIPYIISRYRMIDDDLLIKVIKHLRAALHADFPGKVLVSDKIWAYLHGKCRDELPEHVRRHAADVKPRRAGRKSKVKDRVREELPLDGAPTTWNARTPSILLDAPSSSPVASTSRLNDDLPSRPKVAAPEPRRSSSALVALSAPELDVDGIAIQETDTPPPDDASVANLAQALMSPSPAVGPSAPSHSSRAPSEETEAAVAAPALRRHKSKSSFESSAASHVKNNPRRSAHPINYGIRDETAEPTPLPSPIIECEEEAPALSQLDVDSVGAEDEVEVDMEIDELEDDAEVEAQVLPAKRPVGAATETEAPSPTKKPRALARCRCCGKTSKECKGASRPSRCPQFDADNPAHIKGTKYEKPKQPARPGPHTTPPVPLAASALASARPRSPSPSTRPRRMPAPPSIEIAVSSPPPTTSRSASTEKTIAALQASSPVSKLKLGRRIKGLPDRAYIDQQASPQPLQRPVSEAPDSTRPGTPPAPPAMARLSTFDSLFDELEATRAGTVDLPFGESPAPERSAAQTGLEGPMFADEGHLDGVPIEPEASIPARTAGDLTPDSPSASVSLWTTFAISPKRTVGQPDTSTVLLKSALRPLAKRSRTTSDDAEMGIRPSPAKRLAPQFAVKAMDSAPSGPLSEAQRRSTNSLIATPSATASTSQASAPTPATVKQTSRPGVHRHSTSDAIASTSTSARAAAALSTGPLHLISAPKAILAPAIASEVAPTQRLKGLPALPPITIRPDPLSAPSASSVAPRPFALADYARARTTSSKARMNRSPSPVADEEPRASWKIHPKQWPVGTEWPPGYCFWHFSPEYICIKKGCSDLHQDSDGAVARACAHNGLDLAGMSTPAVATAGPSASPRRKPPSPFKIVRVFPPSTTLPVAPEEPTSPVWGSDPLARFMHRLPETTPSRATSPPRIAIDFAGRTRTGRPSVTRPDK